MSNTLSPVISSKQWHRADRKSTTLRDLCPITHTETYRSVSSRALNLIHGLELGEGHFLVVHILIQHIVSLILKLIRDADCGQNQDDRSQYVAHCKAVLVVCGVH